MPFVFYDTETTGKEAPFDQILQFAAILTDDGFKELDRFEIRCRLHPHVVPAPMAMFITRVKPQQLTDVALPTHYEMVRKIQAKLLSWSPATFVGFNSIRFDEHLLRQAFYQTLHRPYLTSAVDSARCDVMRIAQSCAVFTPDAINIPVGDDDTYVFKLGELAAANNFENHNAHDAMGDVKATIHLAQVIANNAPQVWSSAMRFGKKASAVDHLTSGQIFCFGEVYFGRPFGWTVTCIGCHESRDTDHYVYDLSVDPQSLVALSQDKLEKRLARSPKVVRKVKANGAPLFLDYPDVVGGTSCAGLEDDIIQGRAVFLQNDEPLRHRLIEAFQAHEEVKDPSPYVEAQLYDDFTPDSDWLICEKFHKTPWEKREALIIKLEDPRLLHLGRRLIATERPDVLSSQARQEHEAWVRAKLLSEEDNLPWLTLPNAIAELEGMILEAEGDDAAHLSEHLGHLHSIRSKLLE